MKETIQAVVLGASGYVGGELLRLLADHPSFSITAAVSEGRAGKPIAATFGQLESHYGNERFSSHRDWLEEIEPGSNLALFSAAPHGTSAAMIAVVLAAARKKDLDIHVVDASADFRYSSQADYESVYDSKHGAPELLNEFVCGVPEHIDTLDAPHVGHPGCFATAVLLAAVPLLQSRLTAGDVFVSGITGSTGSGRVPQPGTHHPERHSNLYAYKPLAHRHAPEIAALCTQATGRESTVSFVPHSGPFARGIYVTVQAKAKQTVALAQISRVFAEAYADAPFVRVVDGTPRLKNVVASNYCEIGVATNGDSIVVMSTIDNLVKGAAGGAVQWMNRLWELPETAGLTTVAPGWT